LGRGCRRNREQTQGKSNTTAATKEKNDDAVTPKAPGIPESREGKGQKRNRIRPKCAFPGKKEKGGGGNTRPKKKKTAKEEMSAGGNTAYRLGEKNRELRLDSLKILKLQDKSSQGGRGKSCIQNNHTLGHTVRGKTVTAMA